MPPRVCNLLEVYSFLKDERAPPTMHSMHGVAQKTGVTRKANLKVSLQSNPKMDLMWNAARTRRFRRLLLAWYYANKRDLPWRANRDPYRIWLSEVMLQQTRVAAVMDYYGRFLQRFPSVEKLAAAREESVLAAWSGLGYYRRARMLHAAAKTVVKEYDGIFPSTAESLKKLPGIGRYTAAAIASIAFDGPVAVVDGNVERVLQRIAGRQISGENLWQAAEEFLDRSHPGDFNQAMMELGASVCIPGLPVCHACPVRSLCVTRGPHLSSSKSVRQRKREITYVLARESASVFLVRRDKNAKLMPGMWELPEVADKKSRALLVLRHAITVTDYKVRVVESVAPDMSPDMRSGKWIEKAKLSRLPLTGLTRKILRILKIF